MELTIFSDSSDPLFWGMPLPYKAALVRSGLSRKITVGFLPVPRLRRGPVPSRSGRRCPQHLSNVRTKELDMSKAPLTLYLAAPRGFCAGVDRAIKIVEMALEKWGAPVYVRHEIVHNKFVVDGLRDKGAVFVEELDECPNDRPVIFSAHGVPKSVPSAAAARQMTFVDATCPLVSKVHIEAQRHADAGLQMIMIGHEGHPETVGTMGQLPEGEVLLVETPQDVAKVAVRDPEQLAYVTQTTLSVDDTADIVAALQTRFPAIVGPHKEDICYATTNRQEAVKAMAPKCDAMLVVGAPNSSNSKRLVEVGARAGCAYAQLVQRADDIDWRSLEGIKSIGITTIAIKVRRSLIVSFNSFFQIVMMVFRIENLIILKFSHSEFILSFWFYLCHSCRGRNPDAISYNCKLSIIFNNLNYFCFFK